MKPWLYQARSAQAIPKDTGSDVAAGSAQDAKPEPTTPKPAEGPTPPAAASTTAQPQLSTYRLFGSYMNNVATYQDGTTAWLSSESMLSWVTSSVYERFAGGGYMSGVKLVRGYVEPTKAKEKEKEKDTGASDESQDVLGLDQRQQRILKRRSAPPTTGEANETETVQVETQQSSLERQLSSLLSREGANPAEAEEEIRRREEQEIQDDYNAQAGEAQGREIEHLVLVTHGIGQRLGVRMESINFVHDVNVLRKTLKGVYTNSADLKSLNTELGAGPGNCRVQVLPVCWRHLIDFPRRRQKKGEHDLGEVAEDEDECLG
ncbi:hypothetical protein CDD82_2808 [Ophiocordyceps australis]|uniref:DUF7131 domain-containing protein n=1 Tax=Ophiocordyceps australis TaxID=1399860 RepID=A0A2C5XDJ3_9HYPO|nr:hypothetical protein CDD82_2808 [Ophiocordyceps australis]